MVNNADHNTHSSDEIDLRELVQTLWSSKVLIISIALVITCIAAVYAFVSTPIYQTSVRTLPPTASGLASYNVASQLTGSAIRGTVSDAAPGIQPLKPQEAYEIFLRHLDSSAIRQEFFDEYYLPAQNEHKTEADKQRAWTRLDDELTITLPKKADEYQASVTLEGNTPQTIAQWANAYVDLAMGAASKELLSGLAGEVQIRKHSLDDQIATLRIVAEKVRRDRITRLTAALEIAENIGLESPYDGAASIVTINTEGLNTESVDSGSLLYLRGAKALRSELKQLEHRKTDDAYIAELPDLMKKQALLAGINLNPKLLSVAVVDRAAIAPEEPIKPQKLLIIALGLIFGSVCGVFIAIFRQFLRR